MAEAVVNGFQIYHGILSGYLNIAKYKEPINDINVFPVADGDTGTNMVMTLRNIVHALESTKAIGKLFSGIADSALEGARGNSGLILSQFLNSIARHTEDIVEVPLSQFGHILINASREAYDAVEEPREGTILTVIKAWAGKINMECHKPYSLKRLLTIGFDAATEALEKTPEQLTVLKRNKVVDAGGKGFIRFLEGIENLGTTGRVSRHHRRFLNRRSSSPEPAETRHSHESTGTLTYRYCTEVLLQQISDAAALRAALKPFGDSLIVIEGARLVRVHIHSNQPDKVVHITRHFGTVFNQKVDDMVRQEQAVNRRLGKVAVLTDSIADIPLTLLDKNQIHVLNLPLTWGDDEYIDRLTITPSEFYTLQSQRKIMPKSSIPSRSVVENMFSFLLQYYDSVIALPVARRLSGTWRQLNLAAETFSAHNQRITVIDTKLNSAAQGLLTLRVAEAAISGKNLEELSTLAKNLAGRIRIYVSVVTFKYMVLGGRVSPLKGFAARAMNLKPIVSLDAEGKGVAYDKAFSGNGLLRKIQRIIKKTVESGGIEDYAVVHAAAPDRAEEFTSIATEIIGKAPRYVTDISPIVGMHSGKGAVAIAVLESEKT